ncbi:Creatinase [Chionoecetes opilio]|uniref:Creatinase n=1 Tax=Chionoecetes opilio TaxID=41210 RepID=A0A8J8WFM5_CHIOP|nr:Creatinase [Chionoecetes opilio]
MEQEGLAACLFTSIQNINYFTGGFTYCASGRPYGLLVTPEKHVTISALIDAGQPWRRSPQVWSPVCKERIEGCSQGHRVGQRAACGQRLVTSDKSDNSRSRYHTDPFHYCRSY